MLKKYLYLAVIFIWQLSLSGSYLYLAVIFIWQSNYFLDLFSPNCWFPNTHQAIRRL